MKDIGDYLLEKYGPRLSTADLAEVLHTSPAEVRNRISEERLGIPTFKDLESKRAPRFAHVEHVVEYLKRQATSVARASRGRGGYSASRTASRSART